MKPYLKGLIRWGALGVELFFLFLLVWCIGVCSCPLTPDNLRQLSLFAIGAVAFAFLSTSQSERPKIAGRRKLTQMALEPPIAVLIIAILLIVEHLMNRGQNNPAYHLYRTK